MSERLQRWMQSDLVGVFVVIVVVVVVALSLLVFFVGGPIAGIIFGCAVVGLTFYVISKTSRGTADISDIAPPAAETAQQVLVVANQGLANAALETELVRRAEQGPLDVRLLAPVPAGSLARALADDIDVEAGKARERLDAALGRLAARGIDASGRVDREADPIRCLLDGLREFPADEVLLVPVDESGWEDAEALADRIRAETDIRVTELGT